MPFLGLAGEWPASTRDNQVAYVSRHHVDGRSLHPVYSPGRGPIRVYLQGRPISRREGSVTSLPVTADDIAECYADAGPGFLSQLEGSFALAIVDALTGRCMLAVDRFGIEKVCFAQRGSGFAFGTSAADLAAMPGIAARLRPQAFYDYMLMHMIPAPETVYEGISKLRPGTFVVFERGKTEERHYWRPTFEESATAPSVELARELLSAMETAVMKCEPGGDTGAFLSGGLDSSTVAGMLSKVMSAPVKTFSMGFGLSSHDELEYARISAAHFRCSPIERVVVPQDIVDAFHSIAGAYDEPFGNSSAVPTLLCARLAVENGVSHLLAGDGGDELFGGNERYAKQRLFEGYRHIPAWLRSGILEPMASRIGAEGKPAILGKVASYVQQASIALPERLQTWNLVYRTPAAELLDKALLPQIDVRQPIERMAETYALSGKASMLNQMLYFDWHYTLAYNDLRKVETMCTLAGIKVSYPMLDKSVVELSTRIPSAMKMRGTDLRSFYKEAMSDFLPERILRKEKHGFGLPFGYWLRTHEPLRALILDLLESLGRRRLIEPRFTRKLMDELAGGDPGYYGYAIWDLAMLEGWFQSQPAYRNYSL